MPAAKFRSVVHSSVKVRSLVNDGPPGTPHWNEGFLLDVRRWSSGKIKVEVEMARLMVTKACALYDAGWKGAGEASNMGKYAAAEAAVHAVDQAIQTHGGNGVALEYGISDMWWGARLTRIAPVSAEMILNYVAEHSLGLPKSS